MSGVINRRKFLGRAALVTAGVCSFPGIAMHAESFPGSADTPFTIGPIEGYSPHVGTLVSMLNYNRKTILDAIKGLTVAELDYLHDEKSNTIGALVLHLGATEKFYQINTFEGRDEFNASESKVWQTAQSLGADARKHIKGNEAQYYIDRITEVRQKTLAELKNKDDKWLFEVDPKWSKETPFNTYWKWFHVCEHESNHRGQITWLKRRLPGAKDDGE